LRVTEVEDAPLNLRGSAAKDNLRLEGRKSPSVEESLNCGSRLLQKRGGVPEDKDLRAVKNFSEQTAGD